MRFPFFNTCRIPASLESVTSRRAANEVDPRAVQVAPHAVAHIWRTVERLYQCGMHPAIQLCVRRRGQILVDRAIGHASGNGPQDPPDARKVLATPETPFNVFSTAKAVTSMIVHLLDERNLLRIDDRVCDYIPEFGVHNKEWITLRHLLTHRAGIPNLPSRLIDLNRLDDPERDVAAAIVTSGKPLLYPGMYYGYALVRAIGEACAKLPPRKVLRPRRPLQRLPHALAAARSGLRRAAL